MHIFICGRRKPTEYNAMKQIQLAVFPPQSWTHFHNQILYFFARLPSQCFSAHIVPVQKSRAIPAPRAQPPGSPWDPSRLPCRGVLVRQHHPRQVSYHPAGRTRLMNGDLWRFFTLYGDGGFLTPLSQPALAGCVLISTAPIRTTMCFTFGSSFILGSDFLTNRRLQDTVRKNW